MEDLLDVDPEKQEETYMRMKLVRDRLDAVLMRAETEWRLREASGADVGIPAAQASDVTASSGAPVPATV